jgi:aryl-alcohol dehydrogenase-like predicted oxidoreductase
VREGITPVQIALAWLPTQRSWIVPIPRGSRIDHLDDSLPAVDGLWYSSPTVQPDTPNPKVTAIAAIVPGHLWDSI